jgi:hypothetical protein
MQSHRQSILNALVLGYRVSLDADRGDLKWFSRPAGVMLLGTCGLTNARQARSSKIQDSHD